ncbi:helix-turn-helix domain-containing protein [Echinicola marina]|uniref:Putative transcription factor, MBF1 like protein n=1 Tax=Echinicola vietnamensis (strain DSM 17526 / LMG 23754 / KMM 6221) TaxID=926556 RepID=L0FRW6_ECHVK|nr:MULTISPECIES: helix-turn-helix transcriptional regulator [Cyclobacteriaceae]AGA76674.1 putative transcription factor, MBF1 like protein [Echinicola vietnamensis DSM 17526]MBI0399992.1 helix-turn-helix transcriptional regulator [Cyclobacterium marinum]UCS93815.1 helix-turn-helix domain-containing protein [Echinicola marina]
MTYLGRRIRELREAKGFLLRQVAAYIEADTALVSKLERGERKAQKNQLKKIAAFLEVDEKELELLWLADKIIDDIDQEPQGLNALNFVQGELAK